MYIIDPKNEHVAFKSDVLLLFNNPAFLDEISATNLQKPKRQNDDLDSSYMDESGREARKGSFVSGGMRKGSFVGKNTEEFTITQNPDENRNLRVESM